ncbi:restriction endonuclease [Nocardia elegans]|uniref:Restriction endonuclease n=1 Tax=Nocardia elegans TaxID=300029 RepID=A0ABW6TIA0_9NOCA|nr:restriction endonuclease [Nocardia elegans]MBF6446573.1 restriction endonuclease [Nocardia elegans]
MTLQTDRDRIPTPAYEALRNTLASVVWYKSSFRRLLQAAFREHPELLSGLNFDATKREVIDDLIPRLLANEARYRETVIRVMLEFASLTTFPDLENHGDSENLLTKARAAVAELREQVELFTTRRQEQDRLAAERAAAEQQATVRRKFDEDLNELKRRFNDLHSMNHVHQRGIQFESLLYDLFELFDLEPRMAYSQRDEQIDGAFTFDSDVYLMEAKWTKKSMSREQVDAFASKVDWKGKNTLGLIVSVNGISTAAIRKYSVKTSFITMDGQDLYCVLDGRVRLEDLLARKKRHVNETGECYCPVAVWSV